MDTSGYERLIVEAKRGDRDALETLENEAQRRNDRHHHLMAMCLASPMRRDWYELLKVLLQQEDLEALQHEVTHVGVWLEAWPDDLRNWTWQLRETNDRTRCIRTLVRRLHNPHIEQLETLRGTLPNLRSIEFERHNINDWHHSNVEVIANFLTTCPRLEHVVIDHRFGNISWWLLDVEEFTILLGALPGPSLKRLDIVGCEMGDGAAYALAKATHLNTLEHLRIEGGIYDNAHDSDFVGWGDCLTPEGIKVIASCEHLQRLRTLELPLNKVGEVGGQHIAASSYLRNLRVIRTQHKDAQPHHADLTDTDPLAALLESPHLTFTHLALGSRPAQDALIRYANDPRFLALESFSFDLPRRKKYAFLRPVLEGIETLEAFLAMIGLLTRTIKIHWLQPTDDPIRTRLQDAGAETIDAIADTSPWPSVQRGARIWRSRLTLD